MRTAEGDRIHEIIRTHRGRGQSISARQICLELAWPTSRERLVRRIISDESMLWPRILVCSIAGAEFFCAATCEEAFAHETWLRNRRDQAQTTLDTFAAQCRKLGLQLDSPHFTEGLRSGMAEIMAAKKRQSL